MGENNYWVAKPITKHILPSTPVAELNFRPSCEGPFQCKEQFEIIDELHTSSGGAIYVAREISTSKPGQMYVLKKRRVAELGSAKDMLREYELLRQLCHPNIIQCYGYFWDFGQRSLYIVLEYATCGDLHKELKTRKRASPQEPFADGEIWDIFVQILSGLHYLHTKGIVHRDIKCMNLFLTSDGSIKIGDLGVSRQMSQDTIVLHSFYGTPLYLSPELVEGCPYTQMTDVWSIGVVLYELCTMTPPFDGQSLKQVTQAVLHGRYPPLPKSRDPAFGNLIDKLLQRNPSRRPTCEEILRSLQHRLPSGLPSNIGSLSSPAPSSRADPVLENSRERPQSSRKSAQSSVPCAWPSPGKENKERLREVQVTPRRRTDEGSVLPEPALPSKDVNLRVPAAQPSAANAVNLRERVLGDRQARTVAPAGAPARKTKHHLPVHAMPDNASKTSERPRSTQSRDDGVQAPAGVRSSVAEPMSNGVQVVRIRRKDDNTSERDRRWEARRRQFHERQEAFDPSAITPMTPSVPGDPTGLWFMKKGHPPHTPAMKKRYDVITSGWI